MITSVSRVAGQKREVGAEVDLLGKARDQDEQLTLAQERVGVGAVQRDRPGGEVEDAAAAVGHHQRHRQRGEDRPVGEPEQQEDQMLIHCPSCCSGLSSFEGQPSFVRSDVSNTLKPTGTALAVYLAFSTWVEQIGWRKADLFPVALEGDAATERERRRRHRCHPRGDGLRVDVTGEVRQRRHQSEDRSRSRPARRRRCRHPWRTSS